MFVAIRCVVGVCSQNESYCFSSGQVYKHPRDLLLVIEGPGIGQICLGVLPDSKFLQSHVYPEILSTSSHQVAHFLVYKHLVSADYFQVS